jgi:hypothetical protein
MERGTLGWIRGLDRGTVATLAIILLLSGFLSSPAQIRGQGVIYATSNLTAKDYALSILEHVGGMNLSSSPIELLGGSSNILDPGSRHLSTDIRVAISENNRSLNFLFVFIDDKFWTLDLDLAPVELFGDKTLNDSLSIAKKAVESYREVVNASYCDEFAEMISTALHSQCLTVENDDALLQISHVENCTTQLDYRECTQLQWFKKIKGQCTGGQSVGMSISKNGRVTMLMDNLATFYVATTDINVSEAEAINITMPYAQAYAETHGQRVIWTNATLEWRRDLDSSRGDDLAIYPSWRVELSYDKTNNESVFGYWAQIWADTGQIEGRGSAGGYSAPKSDYLVYPWPMIAVITIVAIVVASTCTGTYLKRRSKARRIRNERLP